MLDELYNQYSEVLNTRLDDTNYLLSQVIDGVNATTLALGEDGTITSALGVEGAIAKSIVDAVSEQGGIHKILNKEVTAVGTSLSNAMNSIWTTENTGTNSILSAYSSNFQAQSTTLNTTLGDIKKAVNKMAGISDTKAQEQVNANKTSGSDKKDPTKNTAPTTKPATNNNANKSSGDGKAAVGDKVKFISGKYYYDSQGKNPAGSKYQGKQVYITKINTASWATHPYHISTGSKLGSGDLGWLKLNQLSGFATGKKNISNSQYAWTQENGQEFIVRPSDGAILTPVAKGDSVLSATASGNIWNMANNPAEFIKNNLSLDSANIPNGANVNNHCVQNFENINFNMPNVHSYNELIAEMQRDPKFEKLILAMTVDQIAGKSKLGKNKAIR